MGASNASFVCPHEALRDSGDVPPPQDAHRVQDRPSPLLHDLNFELRPGGYEIWFSDRIAEDHPDLVEQCADWLEGEVGVMDLGQIEHKALLAGGVLKQCHRRFTLRSTGNHVGVTPGCYNWRWSGAQVFRSALPGPEVEASPSPGCGAPAVGDAPSYARSGW